MEETEKTESEARSEEHKHRSSHERLTGLPAHLSRPRAPPPSSNQPPSSRQSSALHRSSEDSHSLRINFTTMGRSTEEWRLIASQCRTWAAIFGFTGVAAGAFGAHALKATLQDRGTTDSWRTAVQYQLLHALALLAVSSASNLPWSGSDSVTDTTALSTWSWASTLWTGGTFLFSGSIYALSLGGPKLLGPVTPIGGLMMMGGWLALLRT